MASWSSPGPEIAPAAIRSDQHVGLLRPPAATLVGKNRGRRVEHWGDGGPGGLDRVLSCEQRAVARHCVAEQPGIRRLLARMLVDQGEFALGAIWAWSQNAISPKKSTMSAASRNSETRCSGWASYSLISPSRISLPETAVGSACTSTFSRIARRIAVGTLIAERPPHRSGRAQFGHPAPTSGV
jgi:hypothetical protein